MATIPSTTKFIGLAESVDTTERRSALINAESQAYTMQDVTDTVRPYKVFTALLTQSGGNDPRTMQGDGGGDISSATKGTTVEIFSNSNNIDYSSIGAPNSNVGTYFILTQDITLSNLDIDTIFNINTGAPVATVLENTIGNITWSYVNTGNYLATLTGAFPYDKTFITTPSQFTYLDSNGSGIGAQVSSADTINIYSLDANSNANGILNGTPIEIRVYN